MGSDTLPFSAVIICGPGLPEPFCPSARAPARTRVNLVQRLLRDVRHAHDERRRLDRHDVLDDDPAASTGTG